MATDLSLMLLEIGRLMRVVSCLLRVVFNGTFYFIRIGQLNTRVMEIIYVSNSRNQDIVMTIPTAFRQILKGVSV